LKKNHCFVNLPLALVAVFGWTVAAALALPWLSGAASAQTVTDQHAALNGCGKDGVIIGLTVGNVQTETGFITVDVHGSNPADFLKKGKKLDRIRVPARKPKTTVCIAVQAPGAYALTVYHDQDGNRKFNKNFLGIPVEPYGVSNNPKILVGPPSFEEATFNVPSTGTSLNVDLSG